MKALCHVIAVLVMGLPTPAWSQQAGELRKCVSPGGAVSFQQQPCAAGSRQTSSRSYVAEPAPTAEQIRARATREQVARAESAELSRRAGTSGHLSAPPGRGTLHRVAIAKDDAACQRARRHRDETLERVGLKRTYDLLRALNDEVARACR
ncbi:hypothetical protein N800_08395 [Lysobacter daejeonensis GH1-9]|uniref:DUF4124 domain-containing protein n=1 Tax=Lysobacter daejeonensis GH1-9 TaxID=1385517 RepID=A0A0A0F0C2_9GAMM|nr:hypothetical protein N800_08395 [Lysobacter daejeonensis GH1-9]